MPEPELSPYWQTLLDSLPKEHDPEPWFIGKKDRGHGHGDYGVLNNKNELIAECQGINQGFNTARIVNSVNACKGIPEVELKEGIVSELITCVTETIQILAKQAKKSEPQKALLQKLRATIKNLKRKNGKKQKQ